MSERKLPHDPLTDAEVEEYRRIVLETHAGGEPGSWSTQDVARLLSTIEEARREIARLKPLAVTPMPRPGPRLHE